MELKNDSDEIPFQYENGQQQNKINQFLKDQMRQRQRLIERLQDYSQGGDLENNPVDIIKYA